MQVASCNDTPFVDSYIQFTRSEGNFGPVAVGHNYFCGMVGSYSLTRDTATLGRVAVVEPHSRQPPNTTDICCVQQARCRVQCMYCCELFDPNLQEGRSKCRDAPDRVMDWIKIASCASVADTVMYLCLSDSEGDYEPACTCSKLTHDSLKKWAIVILMSFCLPCLCCFWPLVGCRHCAMSCGYCVPRHRVV